MKTNDDNSNYKQDIDYKQTKYILYEQQTNLKWSHAIVLMEKDPRQGMMLEEELNHKKLKESGSGCDLSLYVRKSGGTMFDQFSFGLEAKEAKITKEQKFGTSRTYWTQELP